MYKDMRQAAGKYIINKAFILWLHRKLQRLAEVRKKFTTVAEGVKAYLDWLNK